MTRIRTIAGTKQATIRLSGRTITAAAPSGTMTSMVSPSAPFATSPNLLEKNVES